MEANVDVLVVGAGPTGLALAAQLRAFDLGVRIIDRLGDRSHESRALAVQPRTLEVLQRLGVTAALVEHGNTTTRFQLHAKDRVSSLPLFDIGSDDTAFPYLLFISQADTERFLLEHLDVDVERGVELESFVDGPDGVACSLRHPGGTLEETSARFLAGCDGARSTVRQGAGIAFEGSTYAQTFALGDVEADGELALGAAHAFFGEHGILFFFPLGHPATWRVLGMLPGDDPDEAGLASGRLELSELQHLVDSFTGGAIRLRDPAWLTRFRLHARQADCYRRGRVFVAGDAAHVHSPAGAQGMNTGIQDAWNLGWKLALVAKGIADDELLDTYDDERRPIGRSVVRFTDRAFTIATSNRWLIRTIRADVAPRLIPVLARFGPGRARLFRVLGELDLSYRDSPLALRSDERRRRPRAGDRLPDVRVDHNGIECWLHEALAASTFHLLLCARNGDASGRWPQVEALAADYSMVLTVHHLGRRPPATIIDRDGAAFDRLGGNETTAILVRPDGYIANRTDDAQLHAVQRYLQRWAPGAITPAERRP